MIDSSYLVSSRAYRIGLNADVLTVLEQANDMKNQIEGMAAASLRCIAFAYKVLDEDDIPDDEDLRTWEIPDKGLVFLAVIGIKVC